MPVMNKIEVTKKRAEDMIEAYENAAKNIADGHQKLHPDRILPSTHSGTAEVFRQLLAVINQLQRELARK